MKSLAPFPLEKRVRIRYKDVLSVSETTPWTYVYSANDVPDPNKTGLGHTPTFFD